MLPHMKLTELEFHIYLISPLDPLPNSEAGRQSVQVYFSPLQPIGR